MLARTQSIFVSPVLKEENANQYNWWYVEMLR